MFSSSTKLQSQPVLLWPAATGPRDLGDDFCFDTGSSNCFGLSGNQWPASIYVGSAAQGSGCGFLSSWNSAALAGCAQMRRMNLLARLKFSSKCGTIVNRKLTPKKHASGPGWPHAIAKLPRFGRPRHADIEVA
jgi:hypothetical protein